MVGYLRGKIGLGRVGWVQERKDRARQGWLGTGEER
jgi:hypothetical protein